MTNRTTLIIFCVFAVFLVACAADERAEFAIATPTSPTPTPIYPREKPEARTDDSAEGAGPYRKVVKPSPGVNEEAIKAWRRLVQATDIEELERTELPEDGIEIRIWTAEDLYVPKTRCWILSRNGGAWKGTALVDSELNGRIIRVPLDELRLPSTTWETYVSRNLSPQSIKDAASWYVDTGYGLQNVLEIKYGRVYERQFIANDEFLQSLFTMVKSEFLNNDEKRWRTF